MRNVRSTKLFRVAGPAGYTLLETLIALGILVVFAILGYSVVFRKPVAPKATAVPALKSHANE